MASTGSGYARYTTVTILQNGSEPGLSPNLESLTYTDNASGTIDDIKITVADRDGTFCGWDPQKEDDLDVSIYTHNWTKDGETKEYHCGNFTLDDITYQGSPRAMVVGAVSEPAAYGFKGTKVTKTWQEITVHQIALDIAEKYGMSDVYYWGDEYQIETIEQDGKPDSEFLSELCEKYGFALKIYKKALVLFDEAFYEELGTARSICPADVEPGWEWNSTLQGTYTGARISYTSGKKGETIEVTVGTEERLLAINEKADSLEEAERKAKSAVNAENKKAVTMSFTMVLADPQIVATCNLQIEGFLERINGKYSVDKVVNTVGSGGYTMKVTCHKIMGRL